MAPRAGADRAVSFAPVIGRAPRVLVLGSLPGRASLAAGEYYAHPRNLFWDFIGELLGLPRTLPYAQRLEGLSAQGIALWDMVREAHRPGSLDASIDAATVRHNDIADLVCTTPSLRAVAFNGGKAATLFDRCVVPRLGARLAGLELLRLPSTSPANAGLARDAKRAAWQKLADYLD
ncbi:MAG: hypothetical protein RLZZ200_3120 [Pseudomonadota bacterium]|jgi:hypoxanthine-DNA glycosylase